MITAPGGAARHLPSGLPVHFRRLVDVSVLAVEPDPSWFYSSLAQSSAAVVGFVGAFLIFRIQDYMASWARMTSQIETLQPRWSTAYSQLQRSVDSWRRAVQSGGVTATRQERRQFVSAAMERQEEEAWRDLRPLLDRRRVDAFPKELVWSAALLGGLFIVGTLAPLMFLSAPANGIQLLWVAGVGGAVAIVAGAMLWRAWQEYKRFKTVPLYRMVDGYYETELLQEENWEEQDRQEREEPERRKRERLGEEAEVPPGGAPGASPGKPS